MGRGMRSAPAWQIVLDRVKLANAGWIIRAEAEHLMNEYFDRIEPYWSITTQRTTESCPVVVAGLAWRSIRPAAGRYARRDGARRGQERPAMCRRQEPVVRDSVRGRVNARPRNQRRPAWCCKPRRPIALRHRLLDTNAGPLEYVAPCLARSPLIRHSIKSTRRSAGNEVGGRLGCNDFMRASNAGSSKS